MWAIEEGLNNGRQKIKPAKSANKLKNVWCVGSSPIEFAKTVGENITVIDPDTPEKTAEKIRTGHPTRFCGGAILNRRR